VLRVDSRPVFGGINFGKRSDMRWREAHTGCGLPETIDTIHPSEFGRQPC